MHPEFREGDVRAADMNFLIPVITVLSTYRFSSAVLLRWKVSLAIQECHHSWIPATNDRNIS